MFQNKKMETRRTRRFTEDSRENLFHSVVLYSWEPTSLHSWPFLLSFLLLYHTVLLFGAQPKQELEISPYFRAVLMYVPKIQGVFPVLAIPIVQSPANCEA